MLDKNTNHTSSENEEMFILNNKIILLIILVSEGTKTMQPSYDRPNLLSALKIVITKKYLYARRRRTHLYHIII